jgi:ABC-type amino acid transport substrate-binding protein
VDRIKHGEIADLPDLYGKKVAVITDTTSEDFLRYHNVKIVSTGSFDELLANLKAGRSDAIVYDAPPLMYAAKLDPSINKGRRKHVCRSTLRDRFSKHRGRGVKGAV